jgi:hypothetical protein
MKQLMVLSFAFLMLFSVFSSDAQVKKPDAKAVVSKKIEVYYFHFSRRCNTCKSVEANAQKAVETLYADKVKKGEYSFKSINLDEASSKAIAKKLGVGGQTLLVVCGKKQIDITDKGFMNAQDPEKMKEEIKLAVNQAIKG